MRIHISAHSLTGSVHATFVSESTSSARLVTTDSGTDLWFDDNGRLLSALIGVNAPESEVISVLGPDGPVIIRESVDALRTTDEIERDWEVPARVEESHQQLLRTHSMSSVMTISDQAHHPSDDEVLSAYLGDGIPVAVEVKSGSHEMRAAHVVFPVAPGHTSLRSRDGDIAWNTVTGEMIIRLHVDAAHIDHVWVRVASGETGDLIAVARPREAGDGASIGKTVVPPDQTLGELYVDVTNDPLALIGSSRHRARRRAAVLEELAARTSDSRVSRTATGLARELRDSLGEPPRVPVSAGKASRSWWLLGLVAVLGGVGGFVMGRDGSGDQSSSAPSIVEVPSSTSTPSMSSISPVPSTTVTSPGQSGSLASGMPIESSLDVLAYDDEANAFFGDGDLSVAARVSTTGVVEVQMYTGYEYPYRDGDAPGDQSGVDQCLSERGANTGGDPNFSRVLDVVLLGFRTRDEALAALSGPVRGEVLGGFTGPVPMVGNIIESCELRGVGDSRTVFYLSRQVFTTASIAVDADYGYAVVRVVGDDEGWTSADVIELRP